ncbi:uncharacterized protein LOC134178862 [Corticium candelabrum]|uniref:uncharacterized protein LOC134178862 n=1 Tax=Corticium candelabrum TaxID=121492 RepID=UPI002E25CEB8|nr:uncharacterized protein LOC134178862 [Corticium candelabrum]
MFAAVLSLAVLVISTTPGASTMQYPSGIQMVLQTSNALKSAVQQKSNPKRSSNQVYLQRSGRSVETKRHDDYSPYTSNPYDAGPIDMCSYPQVDVCNFPDGYTVPEYVARDATRFEDIFKNLNELLREEESWTCAKSMMNLACNHAVAPRCVSNTTVRYLGNFMEDCRKATQDCSMLLEEMPNFCDMQSRTLMNGGEFSLTKCRVPLVSGCTNSLPSPDWHVAFVERLTSNFPLSITASKLNLNQTCKSNFMRLACTAPTCGSNNRLTGYKSSTECSDVMNCISDPEVKQVLDQILSCDAADNFSKPSACAGKTRSCRSVTKDITTVNNY